MNKWRSEETNKDMNLATMTLDFDYTISTVETKCNMDTVWINYIVCTVS